MLLSRASPEKFSGEGGGNEKKDRNIAKKRIENSTIKPLSKNVGRKISRKANGKYTEKTKK